MVVTSAAAVAAAMLVVVVLMVVAVTRGGPGRGTTRPAALGWGCTQGPPRAALRHQRVPETDTRGALTTEGTIFQVWLARGPWRWLRGAAEPQLGHGVAVRGPSQKAGGLLTCSWRDGRSPCICLCPKGRPV